MPDQVQAFVELAKKAGYADAQVQVSGCVTLIMPKGIGRAAAAALFNDTPALLADAGLDGQLRSLPSENGSAVVVQGIKPVPAANKAAAEKAAAEKAAADKAAADKAAAEKAAAEKAAADKAAADKAAAEKAAADKAAAEKAAADKAAAEKAAADKAAAKKPKK